MRNGELVEVFPDDVDRLGSTARGHLIVLCLLEGMASIAFGTTSEVESREWAEGRY